MASRPMKLWTASALAVALLPGLGCQARHSAIAQPYSPAPAGHIVAANHTPAEDHVTLSLSSRYRSSTPTARVFRGSVSSSSAVQDELIPR
jgi:hypothetical protein